MESICNYKAGWRERLGKIDSLPLDNLEKKFIESGGEHRKCLASSLFEVKGNPQLDKDSFTFSKDSKYPYFTRTVFNNGILGYVDYLDEEHLIKGNSLAVGMMGMRFFYMKHDFYAGQFTKTAFPIFDGFNEYVALWFISWFNKSSVKYLGLLVRDFENAFNNTELIVPYKDGKVAVDYIESRIRELEAYLIAAGFEDCALTQSERDALMTFRNRKFGYVCIGDLYDKVKLKNKKFNKRSDSAKERSKTFSVPLVNAKHGDNGIMFYGRNEVFDTVSSSIAIIQNGAVATGDVYPQPEPTSVLWDAYLIKSLTDCDTENSLFYITAAIEKTIKLKYNYDKKATWERVKTENIYLPINEQGNIDYAFIDAYVNAIKKQCIAALKNKIDREHKAYERAINTEQTAMQIPIVRNYDEVEFESFLAAEPFECYKWNRFDKDIIDFFGGNKTILVGCSKNKKHLEWIISHNLYNVRLGDTKGSVAVFRNMFDQTSLLLLYDFKRPNRVSAYAIIDHCEMSKQELTQIGYPNPQRKSYMTFQICPIEMDLTLIKNQRLIEKLIEMNPPKDKGTPIFIEP